MAIEELPLVHNPHRGLTLLRACSDFGIGDTNVVLEKWMHRGGGAVVLRHFAQSLAQCDAGIADLNR